MAVILKLLAVCVVISCFISQGYAQAECGLKNIKIKQKPTEWDIHGEQQYNVSIYTDCPCYQYNVYLNMTGFETTYNDYDIVVAYNTDGLVNKGGLLPKNEASALVFQYASINKFPFNPVKSEVAC